jgi:hypothetical protein
MYDTKATNTLCRPRRFRRCAASLCAAAVVLCAAAHGEASVCVNSAGSDAVVLSPHLALDSHAAVELLVDTVGSAAYFQSGYLLSAACGDNKPASTPTPQDSPPRPELRKLPLGSLPWNDAASGAATGSAASPGPEVGPSTSAVLDRGDWLSAPTLVTRLIAERQHSLPALPGQRLFRPPRV